MKSLEGLQPALGERACHRILHLNRLAEIGRKACRAGLYFRYGTPKGERIKTRGKYSFWAEVESAERIKSVLIFSTHKIREAESWVADFLKKF